jgi:hypothetical protein
MRDSPAQRKAPWAVNGFGSTFFHKKVEKRKWNRRHGKRLVGLSPRKPSAKTNKGDGKHTPAGEHWQRVWRIYPSQEGIAKAQNIDAFRNLIDNYLLFRQKPIYPRFGGPQRVEHGETRAA